MITLVCRYCKGSYIRRPSHAKRSKFCSRRCHDKGKEYSDGRKRGLRAKARQLRRVKRLSVSMIAKLLAISTRTVITYVKGIPLSRRKRTHYLREAAFKRWAGHSPTTNSAIKRRLAREGIRKCQARKCRWWRTLELHHEADGTVKVLCPNHHSLTSNWKGRKSSSRPLRHVSIR